MTRKHDYEVSPNRGLVGLGAANFVGSFFNTYPATGGFSRTAVNDISGANTVLAAILSALIVLFTRTDTFYNMPKNVLAAIIFVAVYGLIDFEGFRLACRHDCEQAGCCKHYCHSARDNLFEYGNRYCCWLYISVLNLLSQVSFPHTAVLGIVENEQDRAKHFRNIERFPEAHVDNEVLIFRIDAGLSFANFRHVLDKLSDEGIQHRDFQAADYRLAVILSFEGINSIDVAGLEALERLQITPGKRGISLVAAHPTHLMLPWIHQIQLPEMGPITFMTASDEEALTQLQLQQGNRTLEIV